MSAELLAQIAIEREQLRRLLDTFDPLIGGWPGHPSHKDSPETLAKSTVDAERN